MNIHIVMCDPPSFVDEKLWTRINCEFCTVDGGFRSTIDTFPSPEKRNDSLWPIVPPSRRYVTAVKAIRKLARQGGQRAHRHLAQSSQVPHFNVQQENEPWQMWQQWWVAELDDSSIPNWQNGKMTSKALPARWSESRWTSDLWTGRWIFFDSALAPLFLHNFWRSDHSLRNMADHRQFLFVSSWFLANIFRNNYSSRAPSDHTCLNGIWCSRNLDETLVLALESEAAPS